MRLASTPVPLPGDTPAAPAEGGAQAHAAAAAAGSFAVALVVHATVFWVVFALLPGSPRFGLESWLMAYAAGSGFLLLGRWRPRWQLSLSQALQVVLYAALLALLFWGANEALDVLGASVRARRLPPEQRSGLPLPLFLVPGVASVGLGAAAAAWLRARFVPRP